MPYVEAKPYEAQGLLEKWMEYTDVLVIDDFPVYMPRRVKLLEIGKCEIYSVDSNGFISLEQEKPFTTAYSLRRHLHKTILHMSEFLRLHCSRQSKAFAKFSAEKVEKIFAESSLCHSVRVCWRICEIDDIGLATFCSFHRSQRPACSAHKGGSMATYSAWREFFRERLGTTLKAKPA